MRFPLRAATLATVLIAMGCSQPTTPTMPAAAPSVAPSSITAAIDSALNTGGKPGYEPAYFNGQVVTINAIEVPQNTGPLTHAAADFYVTVYPPNHALWPDTPQCNPCDHAGDGVDFTDYHNHVLDSIPSDPGHGEYNPLWHVFVILPADLSATGWAQYAARLPMKSEEEIDAAIDAGVAQEVDAHFYFICAVVSEHTQH